MPEYEGLRKNFIARFDNIRPRVIVSCSSLHDVQATVEFARRHGITPSIRSGGHCFAGFSLGPGIVIDVSGLSGVRFESSCAQVGSGCRLGDLSARLLNFGATIPCGSCPSVGIGGTTLGGGLGILGRKYGLTCDHLEAAEVVLANGSFVKCSQDVNADLFWALRGAGAGNFGVVTSFTFRTRVAPAMTNFYMVWPLSNASDVISAWQEWVTTTPDEMAAGLALTMSDNLTHDPIVELYGAMLADRTTTSDLLDAFVHVVGCPPATDVRRYLPFRETQLFQAGLLQITDSGVFERSPAGEIERQAIRWTRSEYFRASLPSEVVDLLVRQFCDARRPGELRGLEFAPFGGAYNRVSPQATAFFHRNEMFSLKHVVIVPVAADEESRQKAHRWITRSWSCVHPWGSGYVYPNFPDQELSDPMRAYYGDNHRRLREIKKKYDPDDVFHFAHSIR